ncbi:MAG: fructose-6-phosphate aldolase [Planctomycetes bacterium]|jgi:transaldolase|nr:fructose-6-phosphate aldolase [Planctomycetota bacterium]
MQFFIDTADANEIRRAAALGILDGVTTNPSLVAKTGRPFDAVVREIFSLVKGPISLEVVSEKAEGMVAEGRKLREYGGQAVVKIPITEEGLNAIRVLSGEGIQTNATLCFSSLQALLVAKAGATYVSPFVGRLDDRCHDGMDLIAEIRQIYDNYGFPTKILVASVRHPLHVRDAAVMGADVATIPWSVFEKMVRHPLTDEGLRTFASDWKKVPAK